MWVRWQHSCSNPVPIMIDNLLRTSPEMVTRARNGHIKSVVLRLCIIGCKYATNAEKIAFV